MIDTTARNAIVLGASRVSYEDIANPRKVGTVVDVRSSAWGTTYGVRWDNTDGTVLDYSDLRQAGWNLEGAAPTEAEHRSAFGWDAVEEGAAFERDLAYADALRGDPSHDEFVGDID